MNRWLGVLAGLTVFCGRVNGGEYSASLEGYTIIDIGPYSTVQFETSDARKVMAPVTSESTNAVQVSNSSGQIVETHPDAVTNGFTISSHFQGAWISGYAAAQAGSVHAWARNSAVATPPSIFDPDGVRYLPSPYSAVAHVNATAEASDSLTISSKTLTNGTPIAFNWNFYLEGSDVNTGYQPYGNSAGGYTFPLNLRAGFGFGGLAQFIGNGRDFGGFQGLNFFVPGQLLVQAKVGDVIPIYASVTLFGDAYVDAANSAHSPPAEWSSSGSIDMADTSGMWFDGIPADVQLVSASGFDYTVKPGKPVVVTPDAPVLRARSLSSEGKVEFSWESQTNFVYQPQFLPFVGASNWIDFGTPVAGDGGTKQFTATIDPAGSERLFRLAILP